MAKVVYGPIRAKFKYCPDDSKVKYAEGKCGILEILESENKKPSNHFALFYFFLKQLVHLRMELIL